MKKYFIFALLAIFAMQVFPSSKNFPFSLNFWQFKQQQALAAGDSPTFAGLTLSGLTASTVVYSNASKAITSLANGTGYLYNDGAGALSYVGPLIKADGTVALSADWAAGNFNITSKNIVTTGAATSNFGFGISPLAFSSGAGFVFNVGVGSYPLIISSGGHNVAIGITTMQQSSGDYNNAIGENCLRENSGSYNEACGMAALFQNTGSYNIGIGVNSLTHNAGNNNTAIGSHALYDANGSDNTAIGYRAGYLKADGGYNEPASDNVYIGSGVRSLVSAGSNEIIIGKGAIGAGSNTLTLGNNSITRSLLIGNVENANTAITAGTGTGLTINSAGNFNRQVYKVTVTYAGFAAAALTADHTIATLPAKTKIVGFYADTTVPFTGGAVSAASLTVGKSAGGVEYIATHDVFSGAITRGLADADMGTELVAAALIQGGAVVNWTATTTVSARITTVTANTNQLTAGSVTFYIVTERY